MITMFLLVIALCLATILLTVFMKIALVVSVIFTAAFVVAYVLIRKKGLFFRFDSGWRKYAVIGLRIFLICEIGFNMLTMLVSSCYLIFMNG